MDQEVAEPADGPTIVPHPGKAAPPGKGQGSAPLYPQKCALESQEEASRGLPQKKVKEENSFFLKDMSRIS